jgi:hypothetical protein
MAIEARFCVTLPTSRIEHCPIRCRPLSCSRVPPLRLAHPIVFFLSTSTFGRLSSAPGAGAAPFLGAGRPITSICRS